MGVRTQKSLIEKAQQVADQVKPQVEAALDQAVGLAQEGLKQATPLLEQGKAKTVDVVSQVVDAAAEAATSAQQFVDEKAAELNPEPTTSKGGKLKKFLLLGGLAAAVGLVAKKLNDQKESSKWQPAATPATPTPPPARSAAPAAPAAPAAAAPAADAQAADSSATDDAAGADPAEALADAAEAPHAVTTPDDPAEVVDVEESASVSTPDTDESHDSQA